MSLLDKFMNQKQPLCDIIILTMNQLEVLRPCVESVLKHATIPCRVVIVNNGGGACVHKYLESLKPTRLVTFFFHHFDKNQGFVRGNNIAVKGGKSPYVCLLNNDCIVTPGWIDGMIELCDKYPHIAVVNPQSSTTNTQPGAKNLSAEEAAKYYEPQRGKYNILGAAIGFCMLIRRSLIEKIGLFDEGIDTAYFEDTDFSYRVKEAGFECVQAAGVYVHHAAYGTSGSISLKQREALFNKNRKWFEKKWGKRLRVLVAHDQRGSNGETLGFLLQSLKELGKRDNHVHLIVNTSAKQYKDAHDFLRSFGLDYADVPNMKFTFVHTRFFSSFILFHLATKWRKRYDVVASSCLNILASCKLLKLLLRFWLIFLDVTGERKHFAKLAGVLYVDRIYLRTKSAENADAERAAMAGLPRIRAMENLIQLRKEKAGAL